MDLIDKVVEELHAWHGEHQAKPNRVVVHVDVLELMLQEREATQPPLLHQDEHENWIVLGVPIFSTEQVERGVILIE